MSFISMYLQVELLLQPDPVAAATTIGAIAAGSSRLSEALRVGPPVFLRPPPPLILLLDFSLPPSLPPSHPPSRHTLVSASFLHSLQLSTSISIANLSLCICPIFSFLAARSLI